MSAEIVELPRRAGTGGSRPDGGTVIAFPAGGLMRREPERDDGRAFFLDEGNWRRSLKGNLYVNFEGYNVVVFKRGVGFAWRVENQLSGRTVWGQRDLSTVSEAMADAWAARRGRGEA
jgi:hypothetical protein